MDNVDNIQKLNNRTINILGSTYTIRVIDDDNNDDELLMDKAGVCDWTTRTIKIRKYKECPGSVKDIELLTKLILRHEIIHAYLFESGLDDSSDWAWNEEMVEFFARQFPKMNNTFNSLKI